MAPLMTLRTPDDQDVIVVGASGDLAARKLIPALYNLEAQSLLPVRGAVVGHAVADWDDAAFVEHARQAVTEHSRTALDESVFERFAARLRFVPVSAGVDAVKARCELPERVAYLAVPPSAFAGLIDDLGRHGLGAGTKVIIEKPFGHDGDSAAALNADLHKVFPEERIYRIDHYLGKETVQNLLVFRFGNTVYERVWNRDCIQQVEITVAEDLGVEQRGRFYEETGAIRDIVQNHIFQVLSLVAMEPPVSFEADALRNEKCKVLRSVHPLEPATVVRGQYTTGAIAGTPVPGYRDEPGVAAASEVETYAALRIHLDSWRWSGVPFLIRTGKRLARRETTVVISFHPVPLRLFQETPAELDHNRLIIRIQPDEGIDFTLTAKEPGPQIVTRAVHMSFSYAQSFMTSPPEAYERLLHDVLVGDHTLFISEAEVTAGWAAVDPVLRNPPPITFYPAGSWGPAEAASLSGPCDWHEMEPDLPEEDTH
jgi:glucose-6-phosphate 1-dehydrogenase